MIDIRFSLLPKRCCIYSFLILLLFCQFWGPPEYFSIFKFFAFNSVLQLTPSVSHSIEAVCLRAECWRDASAESQISFLITHFTAWWQEAMPDRDFIQMETSTDSIGYCSCCTPARGQFWVYLFIFFRKQWLGYIGIEGELQSITFQ